MNFITTIINALGGWDAVIKIITALIAAFVGVPMITKEPSKIPLIGRLYPTDDDKERKAIGVIAAIRAKREAAAKEAALLSSIKAGTEAKP